MKRYKSLQYRIYPTEQQQQLLMKIFAATVMYNHYLQKRSDSYQEHQKSISSLISEIVNTEKV